MAFIKGHKYRRNKANQASEITLKSGDTFTAEAGSTVNLSGAVAEASEVVTTTNVITAAENGKIFYLNLAGGFTSTLPAQALGMHFRFVVKTAPTTNYVIAAHADDQGDIGGIIIAGGAAEAVLVGGFDEDNLTFVANQAQVGDWAEFRSDGTKWYVSGAIRALAGATFNT